MDNYKKIIIIFGSILLFLGCNNKSKNNFESYPVVSELEKVIISDSMDYPSINFIISFKNTTSKDIFVFTNSFYKKNYYEDSGIMISIDNIKTPIGAMLKSDFLIIKAYSKIKILFSYSEQYPNKWIDINNKENTRKELLKIVKRVTLTYDLDKKLQSKTRLNLKNKNKIFTLNQAFLIEQKEYELIYKSNITLDEIIKLLK